MAYTADAVVVTMEAKRSIKEIADECLEEAKGSSNEAVLVLAKRLAENQDLLQEHLQDILKAWARQVIHSRLHGTRQNILRAPAFVDGSAFREAAAANTRRLMDMPIWGGKPIGKATAVEIRASADQYLSMSADAQRKAVWQEAVAETLEKNGTAESTVQDCLPEATLIRLWAETENA